MALLLLVAVRAYFEGVFDLLRISFSITSTSVRSTDTVTRAEYNERYCHITQLTGTIVEYSTLRQV